MTFIPKPQEIYKHFKGNLYQIVTIAQHTESDEPLVVYQALYGDFKIYARPLEMFISPVDKEKYPNATQEYRFELQGANAERMLHKVESHVQKVAQQEPPQQEPPQQEPPQQEPPQQRTPQQEPPQQRTLQQETPQPVAQVQEVANEEPELDPLLLQFLDADSYEERLNILAGLHHRITDDMITTMAIACDIEVEEGSTQARYESLKSCLMTLEKYECNRLR